MEENLLQKRPFEGFFSNAAGAIQPYNILQTQWEPRNA
jgi:hypothetical protein